MFRMIAIVAGSGTGARRPGGGPDAAEGRNHPHDGALWFEFHQPRHPHHQRAQDEIYAKALHRSLYIWDSAEGKPVPELAKEAVVSGGVSLHLQAARRRLFPQWPQDDGRRRHLVLQPHHGRHQGLSRRALCPHDRGRGRGREGPGQGDLRPEEDRRLHPRDEADRESRSWLLFLHRADLDLSRRRGRQGQLHPEADRSWPFKFVEHVPGSRIVMERWDKFYKPGKPYADKVIVSIMGEAAARDVAFRNKEIDTSVLGPRSMSPIRPIPTSRAPSPKSPKSSRAIWG